MKILVTYYSRTGNTKKIANAIANELKCDIEEIFDVKGRKGPLGYLRSSKEAMRKMLVKIKPIKKDPSKYDLVVIGTPVWGWNMSSPIRTYISNNKFKKVAFFCTMSCSGAKKIFKDMEELCKSKPVAQLQLIATEVKSGRFSDKIKKFIASIKQVNSVTP